MSEIAAMPSHFFGDENTHARLILVVGTMTDAGALRERLAAGGYEVLCAPPDGAVRAASELKPSLALFAFGAAEGEGDLIAAARRLRSTPETFTLPLVFLFKEDERALRSAALNVGAEDYFALNAPHTELRARLEGLFWRAEAGRRAAPLVADQLSEIDNFHLLLDAVGRDIERGAGGTLALVGLAGESARAAEAEKEHALAAAHGFLKLNLRRVDAVAFYGLTTLLVYLPQVDAPTAQGAFTHLRAEFLATRPGLDLAAGLVSFPADDDDKVEALIEKAEIALRDARSDRTQTPVVAYPAREEYAALGAQLSPAREPPGGTGRAATTNGRTGVAVETSPRAAAAPGARERERPAHVEGGPRRLLLAVSDTTRMAQINLLMRTAGYEVRAAFDGQQALNLLRIERPDLVLVDHALNDIDGLEMLKRFRRQSGGKIGPAVVLMLPAECGGLREEAVEAGAQGTIELPYDPVELLNVVRTTGSGK